MVVCPGLPCSRLLSGPTDGRTRCNQNRTDGKTPEHVHHKCETCNLMITMNSDDKNAAMNGYRLTVPHGVMGHIR
jgi:Fe2+ or Zn2+ uptake regulation protein